MNHAQLDYHGFQAHVRYDDRDRLLVGRVLGADDHIGFHGATLAELTAAFEAAVDDYLADCRERGTSPLPPATSGP